LPLTTYFLYYHQTNWIKPHN